MLFVASSLSTTIVGLVFFASGALKVGAVSETELALTALGVPRFLRNRSTAALVPYAELALAIALACAPSPLFTAVAAATVVVTATFLVLAARSARKPEAVFCNCFGVLSTQPVGRITVIRNAFLCSLTIISLIFAREGVALGIANLDDGSLIAYLSLLCLALAAVVVFLLARTGRRRGPAPLAASPTLDVPAIFDGTPWPIPDVEVTTQSGDVVPLAQVATHKATLLFLVSAGCAPCQYIVSSIPAWQHDLRHAVDIALLTSEKPSVIGPLVVGLATPIYFGYRALFTVTRLPGVPAAFLLTPDGSVSAGPALGRDEIDDMVAVIRTAVESHPRSRLSDGSLSSHSPLA